MVAADLSYTDVEIGRSAAECYALVCDVMRLPEWVAGIATVTIVDTDDAGRASRVEFVTMPGSGSLAYVLCYSYDDDERTVRWRTPNPDDRDVRGEARIESVSTNRCRLRYGLFTSVSTQPPFWAQEALAKDQPTSVVESFRRWVQRQPAIA